MTFENLTAGGYTVSVRQATGFISNFRDVPVHAGSSSTVDVTLYRLGATIQATVDNPFPSPGATITYTITITGHVSRSSSGFTINDTLPDLLADQVTAFDCVATVPFTRCEVEPRNGSHLLATLGYDDRGAFGAVMTVTAIAPMEIGESFTNTICTKPSNLLNDPGTCASVDVTVSEAAAGVTPTVAASPVVAPTRDPTLPTPTVPAVQGQPTVTMTPPSSPVTDPGTALTPTTAPGSNVDPTVNAGASPVAGTTKAPGPGRTKPGAAPVTGLPNTGTTGATGNSTSGTLLLLGLSAMLIVFATTLSVRRARRRW